jgi:hypothetical protein
MLIEFLKEITNLIIKVETIFALNMEAVGSFEMVLNTEENKSCRNFETTIKKKSNYYLSQNC